MLKLKKWSSLLLLGLLMLGLMPADTEAAPAKTVMYFYGSTCPACKEVAPVIEKMIAKGTILRRQQKGRTA